MELDEFEEVVAQVDHLQTKKKVSLSGHMPNQVGEYTQDISPDESFLGFQRLLVDGIGAIKDPQARPTPVPVVAKILNSSDILIKVSNPDGNPAFSHRRWGFDLVTGRALLRWIPIGKTADPVQYISDFGFDIHDSLLSRDILGEEFTYTVL
jgi:hypothetical protein